MQITNDERDLGKAYVVAAAVLGDATLVRHRSSK
jgi:hypothetical protein